MDTDRVIAALISRYGAWFIGCNMFWPVWRDFWQGFMTGLLGG
jgi:hypothetical protein